MNENVSTFAELSIVEGIDEIMAEMIQIEGLVDDNDLDDDLKNRIKQSLSVVQKKLTDTRMKCNAQQNAKFGNVQKQDSIPEWCYNNLRLQLEQLTSEIQNRKNQHYQC